MKRRGMSGGTFRGKAVFLAVFCAGLLLVSCGGQKETQALPASCDLVVYTVLEEAFYEPVIKEFEERTDLSVQVVSGSTKELLNGLAGQMEDGGASQTEPEWDLVFGVDVDVLEQMGEVLEPYESREAEELLENYCSSAYIWTGFSSRPLVIMYNTNVVTYRELPVGWKSLLAPRWEGRVALMDPNGSQLYASALATAVSVCPETPDYLERIAENLKYTTLDSSAQVNSGIADGRYSLGVTMEESAQALRAAGADIDYIYPEEGTMAFLDGTAIRKGCAHPQQARQFVDFTVSQDVQRILVSHLNRRSVRRDVKPQEGLEPISRLPLIQQDLHQFSQEKQAVLEQWNDILGRKEGEDS